MKKPCPNPFRSGFTLIELSIVLVIIGLLVGGILVGQDLIKAANLRAVISDVTAIKAAVVTYRIKYNAIPGDDPAAQSHFGAAACPDQDPVAGQVCNGNGDGFIVTAPTIFETYEATQHLGLASLIPGNYTATYHDIPTNIWQQSKIEGGFYRLASASIYYRNANYVMLANEQIGITDGSVLNTIDAYSIDSKLDDGSADSGSVYTFNGPDVPFNTCATGNYNLAHGSYIMTNTKIGCVMVFFLEL
jgi:prepilin-type N-terminal cleavage/methylation domain-containing protein